MSFSRSRRLNMDFKEMMSDPPKGCSIRLYDGSDMNHMIATIDGPADSPYVGGKFELDIKFGSNYPFKPPVIKFITRIYHPNIDSKGNICLDVLKSQWSPALNIKNTLLSISSLLTDPNPDDPLVGDIASLYKKDRKKYDENAKNMTKSYAMGQTNNDYDKRKLYSDSDEISDSE